MKKVLSIILAIALCFGSISIACAADLSFSDVKKSDWYYNDVKTAVELGLVNGKGENSYAPNDNLTYAEAIKLAACMHQLYTEGAVTIKGGNPWYRPFVDYCLEKEIIKGDYNYTENATRAGYMEIFANALPGDGLKAINNVPDGSIPDVPASHKYAKGIYKLYRAGILIGVDAEHNCTPNANIKRSEVAAILTRMMNKEKRVSFTMGEETVQKVFITKEPQSITAEVGETVTLTVAATGGTPPYEYQWMRMVTTTSGKRTWSNISDSKTFKNTNTDTLSVTGTNECTMEFSCIVCDIDRYGAQSSTATVKFVAATPKLEIQQQPEDATITLGKFHNFVARAKGGKPPYEYQWEIKDGKKWVDLEHTSFTKTPDTDMLTVYPADATEAQFRCVITDADGERVISDVVNFVCVAPDKSNPLEFTKHPKAVSATIGKGDVVLSAEAKGGSAPYTYQWLYQSGSGWVPFKDSDSSGMVISGATTNELTLNSDTPVYMNIVCMVVDSTGVRVVSNAAPVLIRAE